MTTIEKIARNLIGSSSQSLSENMTAAEMHVLMLPVEIIKEIHSWLEEKSLLQETDLHLAIMTYIALGEDKGAELESEFPELQGCNPAYSFRKFTLTTSPMESVTKAKGLYKVHLVEAEQCIDQGVVDILLNSVITEQAFNLHPNKNCIKATGGIIVPPIKVRKDDIEITVDCADIERAFVIFELDNEVTLDRPDYLKLTHRKSKLAV